MVNGPSPGPPPAAQARDSSSRLTRSSWRTWPHRKLRRNVPRVEGALTMHPSTEEVRPARSASASSMQSPPASAEATSVSILSPAFARPGASPRSTWLPTSSRRPRRWARVTGRSSPALFDQAVVVEGDLDAVGVLLVSGRFPLSKTIIPDAKEHSLTPSPRRDAHLFGGLGLRSDAYRSFIIRSSEQ